MCIAPSLAKPHQYWGFAFLKNTVVTTLKHNGKIYSESQKYAYYSCGKCFQCRERKIEAWQIRWNEQLKNTTIESSYLITLTYDDANIPIIQTPKGNVTTLRYSDLQKFLKRLRKRQDKITRQLNIENPEIKYHACGEYGKNFTKRPHYHILITGLIVYPEEIEKIWGHGLVHIGDTVNAKTIKYVLKYTLKNSLTSQKTFKLYQTKGVVHTTDGEIYNFPTNKQFEETTYVTTIISKNQENSYRVAEKTLCSKGIGKAFLTPELKKFYEENPNAHYVWQNYNGNGSVKHKPLPRYYSELIFNPNVIENGKIKRDDHYRPIKLYNPHSENFEETPRYKRLTLNYKKLQYNIFNQLERIERIGYENYILENKLQKQLKTQMYKENANHVDLLQQDKNRLNNAILI